MHPKAKKILRVTAGVAAMITPPWNIACWIIGATRYYRERKQDWDDDGTVFVGEVLMAPITLPQEPFERRAAEKREQERIRHDAQIDAACVWLKDELEARGIPVESAGPMAFWAQVVAKPPAHKLDTYANVYALAVRNFAAADPPLDISLICSRAQPLQPLDRAWAEANRFDHCARERFTTPCVDCGEVRSLGWRFERIDRTEAYGPRKTTLYLADGGKREIDGHICKACCDKIAVARRPAHAR